MKECLIWLNEKRVLVQRALRGAGLLLLVVLLVAEAVGAPLAGGLLLKLCE
jgi:hypothetical protein